MKVKELKEILNNFPDELEIMTKKTELLGNIGYVNIVKLDTYGFFGVDIPCVLLTDGFEGE